MKSIFVCRFEVVVSTSLLQLRQIGSNVNLKLLLIIKITIWNYTHVTTTKHDS